MMNASRLTCGEVADRDLAERYVTERLAPQEAERLEAHYFECDACWEAVHEAVALRAALGEPVADVDRSPPAGGAAEGPRPERASSSPRWKAWVPLAAAAAVAALLLGPVDWGADTEPSAGDVVRGPTVALAVEAAVVEGGVRLSWAPVEAAERYEVRLFTGEGELVAERETAGPELVLAGAASRPDSVGGDVELYARVRALDRERRILGESPLIRIPGPTRS